MEARKLQYMTVFSTGDRDLQVPQAFDHEDLAASPTNSAGRSSLNTPQRDPKQKMSFADYNKLKKEGIKPLPRTSATPDLGRPKGHARTLSNVSNATPMARGPSYEGSLNGEIQKNGNAAHSTTKAENGVKNGIDRYVQWLIFRSPLTAANNAIETSTLPEAILTNHNHNISPMASKAARNRQRIC